MPKVDVNGVKIYYEISGEEDAFPMIWQGHNHKDWMWQQAYFSEWYKVITYDRRDCGFTEAPPQQWSRKDLVEDLLGLCNVLGIKKAIVGGSSAGASLSMNFAIDHLDRVAAVIANGTSGMGIIPIPELDEWYDELKGKTLDLKYQPKSGWWDDEWLLTTNPEIEKSRHGGYYLKLLSEAHKRTDWQKMFHAEKYSVTNRLDKLQLVGETIPVLFMKGSHEAQGELLGLYELHKRVPNSEFIINKDCYHATPREHPELFNSRVHEWLKRNGL